MTCGLNGYDYIMIAVARNISYGAAYDKYITRKELAVFVGAKNVIASPDLIVTNDQLDDLWDEFEDAGRNYVSHGKDVTNTIIAIEYSPTMNESANWTKQDWFNRAEELLKEIDSTDHSKAQRDPKTGDWKRDENGKKILFPVPHTHLNDSKWMAMLHRDSDSGIFHLHIAVSRFTEDNELNCVTDIAKRSAIAAENINKRNGWTQAMDIRQQHIDEINAVINTVMDEMQGEKFDAEYFKKRIEGTTYMDYKNRPQNYTVELHYNSQGVVDGYAIGRGKSTFTALQLGQKIKAMPVDVKTEIKDNIYDILRSMNTPKFDWETFIEMLEAKTYTDADGNTQHYQFDGRANPDGGYYNYSVIRDGKKYNASQIGSKLTAKKIAKEYEKERQKTLQKSQQTATNVTQSNRRSDQQEQYSHTSGRNGVTSVRQPLRYEDVNAANVQRVVSERLQRFNITPGNYEVNDKTEILHDLNYYLRSIVDNLNKLEMATVGQRQSIADDAYIAALAVTELQRRNNVKQNKTNESETTPERTVNRDNKESLTSLPSLAETERHTAIEKAHETLAKWVASRKDLFSDSDEKVLGLGIGAKCIENGQSPWIDVNMQGAARELANEIVESTSLCVLRMTQLAGEILMNIAMPEDVSLGGPSSDNSLPQKKDDNWNRFKNTFGMYLRSSKLKR